MSVVDSFANDLSTERQTPRLEVVGIDKEYPAATGPIQILRGLSLRADRGEFVSIVGPSGCGKSTLFNIITGLVPPTAGSVLVNGEDVTGSTSRHIGYVLQKDLLFPWRTVLENVVLGLEVRGVRKKDARTRARSLFATYKLEGYEDKYPSDLSGGMKQRAALMRTMVTDPDIILMDEAYKALDYPLKIALESELLETARTTGKTVVAVTHDIEEAVTMSDRVYVLKARPGEVVSEFPIDLGTTSTDINERRLAPRFNEFYEKIWRGIGQKPGAA
ncbi:ABC transporter ATP-binding protein [Mycolicibacterium smegmatis]|uniref:ABC transporter ATP-binding protein n=2 Tax=Mycolicibacterium smegmatis TaxID=1772 RepID=I7G1X0_MYCS2|nr:ABC transporter ATP-binding protein [Mycolicibacterium smegmatis MC2 155]MBE9620462.1 ABC transporter ATP-binding protein [Mycolicibacterium smegmatis]MBE9626747.1 ABC transporter ATP-binding protein [Mycolicibacterium smegmatis]MBE9633292.1 ABC transporter ATP-binding protein [Mycolicibacterium smegmatis]MBE9645378.1 ABC transporter ATP-binding protein [Mycolicibacterium smegmatis]